MVILLLVILQAALLSVLYIRFTEYIANINVIMGIFTAVMVIYLYNSKMDSSSKLTWMMLIAIFPIPGAILLNFTRMDYGSRTLKRSVKGMIERTRGKIPQDQEIIEALDEDGGGVDDLYRFIGKTGNYPIYRNTAVKYFADGTDFLQAVLEDLEKAKDYIFIEYFIIAEGYMWGRILDVLARKAAEGVDVRVMYDGMCEMLLLPPDYPARLGKLGIKCREFSKLYPFLSTYYNYRDHRKILVVDGKAAYTGGLNLADEYMNLVERFGYWKDTAVRLEGDAVNTFTLMFLQLWNIPYPEPSFEQVELFRPVSVPSSTGFVMPFADSPMDSYRVGEGVFMDTLSRAKNYVHIMTPYLIIDDTMKNALKFAASRDIDVKLILPGIPDKKLAYSIAKSHYRELTASGVKIYEYTPGFVHAKVMTSDGIRAMVGSINLDYRSLYHHFECAAYMYRCDEISVIEEDFQKTLKDCRLVTPETIKHEKLIYKIAGRLFKFVAPLL